MLLAEEMLQQMGKAEHCSLLIMLSFRETCEEQRDAFCAHTAVWSEGILLEQGVEVNPACNIAGSGLAYNVRSMPLSLQ